MSVRISAGDLSQVMRLAAGIVERGFVPILERALLRVTDAGLEIVASDLDLELRQTLPLSETGEGFAVAVDARRLASIVAACPASTEVELHAEDGRLAVKAGRSRWTLPSLNVADFPALPVGDLCEPVVLPGKTVSEAFGRTHPFVVEDFAQAFLGGVWLHGVDGQIRVVGMSGKRGLFVALGVAMPKGAEPILLSAKCAQFAEKLAVTASSVSIAWGGQKVRIDCGSAVIVSKGIDQQLPDYPRALPREVENPILIDPMSLKSAARRAALVNTTKTRAIKFIAADDKVALSLADPVGGVSAEEVPASVGSPHEFGVNADFLEAVCSAVGGETIEIHKSDEAMSGALIHRVPRHDAFAFIFPMAI